jgi:hypothetical protein
MQVRKRDEIMSKNFEIQKACVMLEREIKRLRRQAEEQGVVVGKGMQRGPEDDGMDQS